MILIDDPKAGQYYGGAVSAPVFSNIMGYALRSSNISPDAVQTDKTAKRVVKINKSEKTPVN